MTTNLFSRITHTMRGRLTLWYVTTVCLIIIIILIITSSVFFVTLQNQIDHHVHIAVNEASQIVENYRGPERDNLIKNLVSARGMTVIVLSPDGSPLLETNSPDVALITEHNLQQILASANLNSATPAHFTENNFRFAALPVQVNSGKGIVAVGYSTRIMYDTMLVMLEIFAATVILLVLPLTFFGYRLLKNQLQPLEAIAHQAKSITDSSVLSKRIGLSAQTSELITIQNALNTMLSRLEVIFNNERQFFSDAAHTLKTPLAVMRAQIENSDVREKLKNKIIDTIDNASETVDDLLFLSRTETHPLSREDIQLSETVTGLAELAKTLGETKSLKVTSHIQPGIRLTGDKHLLKRALGNIVHNSIVYNKQKGSLDIRLEEKSGMITLTVKDAGIGITDQDLAKVSGRFFRGSNVKNQGSGLGLAISRKVIEKMEGKMSISSKINKGTTVRINLRSH